MISSISGQIEVWNSISSPKPKIYIYSLPEALGALNSHTFLFSCHVIHAECQEAGSYTIEGCPLVDTEDLVHTVRGIIHPGLTCSLVFRL